jgi:hypothetical protein
VAATVNRIISPLAAALTLAASQDQRINNKSAWKVGLQKLPGAGRARNVVLAEAEVRAVVAAAYEDSFEWGLLIETAAVTGASYSQLARIDVAGLQADRLRVMIPVSRKGRGKRAVAAKPVPTRLRWPPSWPWPAQFVVGPAGPHAMGAQQAATPIRRWANSCHSHFHTGQPSGTVGCILAQTLGVGETR